MANEAPETTAEAQPQKKQINRDDFRKSIFEHPDMKLKTVTFEFNGHDVEFRQPSIDKAKALEDNDDGRDNVIIRALIAFTYIPGTDETVFEYDDYDKLMKMPMGTSFQTAVREISSLLDLKVEDKVKN